MPKTMKQPRSVRLILELAYEVRDVAFVGSALGDLGSSCDDLKPKTADLAAKLDRYFGVPKTGKPTAR